MTGFNTRIPGPEASDVPLSMKAAQRAEIERLTAEFLAQGGTITEGGLFEVAPLPMPRTAPRLKAVKKPAQAPKSKKPDTPLRQFDFQGSVVRVFVSPEGRMELILVDVAEAIDAHRSSFSTRFVQDKQRRQMVVDGCCVTYTTSSGLEVIQVVQKMARKFPARAERLNAFIDWVAVLSLPVSEVA